MTQAQPFEPDEIYCAYCHAVAAGPCAVCGAICCGDCVELVMGLTTRRAVCRSCLEKGLGPAERRLRFPLWVSLVAVGAVVLLLFALV